MNWIDQVQEVINEHGVKSSLDVTRFPLDRIAKIIEEDTDGATWILEAIDKDKTPQQSVALLKSMTAGYVEYMAAIKSIVIDLEKRGDISWWTDEVNDPNPGFKVGE